MQSPICSLIKSPLKNKLQSNAVSKNILTDFVIPAKLVPAKAGSGKTVFGFWIPGSAFAQGYGGQASPE